MNEADQFMRRQWQLSSNGETIDPAQYPYLIDWVNSAKNWVETYQIREFIPANDEGFDPSGRVTPESEWATDLQGESPIPAGLIWSSTGLSELQISTKLCIGENRGTDQVFGWYIGEVSHQSENIFIDSMMHVCKICRGTKYVLIPENFQMEDRDPESKYELREDQDGLHFIPLEGYTLLEDEWEIEYECGQHICADSWIFLEDTDFELHAKS
jgi:hypothetical protein